MKLTWPQNFHRTTIWARLFPISPNCTSIVLQACQRSTQNAMIEDQSSAVFFQQARARGTNGDFYGTQRTTSGCRLAFGELPASWSWVRQHASASRTMRDQSRWCVSATHKSHLQIVWIGSNRHSQAWRKVPVRLTQGRLSELLRGARYMKKRWLWIYAEAWHNGDTMK